MHDQRKVALYAVAVVVACGATAVGQPEGSAGGSARQPAVISAVAPQYPDLAVAARVEAAVEVEVDISPEGAPSAVRWIKGHPLFDGAAAVAARRWRFEPSLPEGTRCRLVFEFHILPEGTPYSEAVTRFLPPYRIEVQRVALRPTVLYSR